MMSGYQNSHYQKLDRLFEKLLGLNVLDNNLSALDEVRHFLDHGEYGLAFDSYLSATSKREPLDSEKPILDDISILFSA